MNDCLNEWRIEKMNERMNKWIKMDYAFLLRVYGISVNSTSATKLFERVFKFMHELQQSEFFPICYSVLVRFARPLVSSGRSDPTPNHISSATTGETVMWAFAEILEKLWRFIQSRFVLRRSERDVDREWERQRQEWRETVRET